MVHDNEDEFFCTEGDIFLTDIDTFISKVKTYMMQVLPDTDFRMYIGIDPKKKCFQLWFKDNEENMYVVKTDFIEDNEEMNKLSNSERDNLK